ncbi:nucleoside recognition domain-containing protein [Peribacillus loiseleuriae]|uniref:nucleoside recognition domain-containing protein n=1 Tax=Peribacillus loiseleuriae TaxID=1679170 RepID=UPI003804FA1F
MKIALIGLESSGKTTLLKGVTHKKIQVEGSNVKGATASPQEVLEDQVSYIDTPGIRISQELVSSSYTRKTADAADQVWFVIRGTHFLSEWKALRTLYTYCEKPIGIVVSFEDKMDVPSKRAIEKVVSETKLPLLLADMRKIDPKVVKNFTSRARVVTGSEMLALEQLPLKETKTTFLLEGRVTAPALAFMCLVVIYSLPVFLAYQFSSMMDDVVETHWMHSFMAVSTNFPKWLEILLLGDFGLISLGIYSFVWAFPVVVLFGISVAITEESGLKDRITDSLDPLMRQFGLTGQDLVPIISGFGCNVVAIEGTRNCNVCTRKNCVSVISFGSACSYQLGATLSVFGAAGHIKLMIPYIGSLIVISLLHVKFWRRQVPIPIFLRRETFLQWPSTSTLWFRVKPVISQFLFQAMPIFLLICVIASSLELVNGMTILKKAAVPLLSLVHLPAEMAPAFIASIFRKDGILLLNQDGGTILSELNLAQLFIIVFLCSTFTSCMVTLFKIAKELSWKEAFAVAGKQMVTSMVSVLVFTVLLNGWWKV